MMRCVACMFDPHDPKNQAWLIPLVLAINAFLIFQIVRMLNP